MTRLAVLSCLLLLGSVCIAQENPSSSATFKVPPDLVGKANPVKPTPDAMVHVKKVWGYDCAMCHNTDGDGKGELAVSLKLKLKDYTDPASLKDISDGELYYIILKGKGEMPGEEGRGKPDDLWNMVTLVRSFAKK